MGIKYYGCHRPLPPPERHVGPGKDGLGGHPQVPQEGKAYGGCVHPGEGVLETEGRSEQGGKSYGGAAAGDGPLHNETGEEARGDDIS